MNLRINNDYFLNPFGLCNADASVFPVQCELNLYKLFWYKYQRLSSKLSLTITCFDQPIQFIRSKSLWRWYVDTNIKFLDIIRRPAFCLKTPSCFYLKTQNLGTEFSLLLQAKPTQLGPIDRARPYPGDGIRSPKCCFRMKHDCVLDKNGLINCVQI
jgi:hypothetical protein